MIAPNFIDEIDCGNFFDQIDDFLDFPIEDVEASLGPNPDGNSFPSIWTTESGSLPCSDSVLSGTSASDLSVELSVPYEDMVQLEWLSNIVDDSFTDGSLTMKKDDESSINKKSTHNQFRTSSPVSVLESSSSCSGEKNRPHSPETITPARCGRARSKRPRPATFNPRPVVQLISPTSSVTETTEQLLDLKGNMDTENFAESRSLIKMPIQVSTEHKKKKIKFKMPQPPAETNQSQISQVVRKCMHCEITKTPQWRAGPMGPKTLCNACGVRYKSGRLFPEYRPAASPTFVPALHSNSHKKVLEMRIKACDDTPELIPNTNNSISLDYM